MGENDSVDSGGFDVPNQIRRPTNAPGAGVTVVDGKCTSPTKSLAPFFFVGAGKDRELRLPLFGSTRWSVCCLVARIAIHPTRAEPFVVSHPPPPIYCPPIPPFLESQDGIFRRRQPIRRFHCSLLVAANQQNQKKFRQPSSIPVAEHPLIRGRYRSVGPNLSVRGVLVAC